MPSRPRARRSKTDRVEAGAVGLEQSPAHGRSVRAPLADRHAVVTGGGRGIGAAIARTLVAHGAHVTILGRDPNTLAAAIEAFDAPGMLHAGVADVTDASSLTRAFEHARHQFGPVQILVNNAGQAASAPIRKMDLGLWRRMMAVNLDGPFNAILAVATEMTAAGWGRIVNIASTAGLVGYRYVSAYCASKHGLVGLTRALAIELATTGVTVNAVCPGFTDTDMLKQAVAAIVSKTGRTADQATAELLAHNPQQRPVRPEEVANAVAWLCLPGSEAVTGQAIAVAGGEPT
jgi:NAD(P)-dependent dehydrogenase (short-subunit alcohol dehydrogenase family)